MPNKKRRMEAALQKELNVVARQEEKLRKAAAKKAEKTCWQAGLTEKVPKKVYHTLEQAFCKAFFIIFEKGMPVIEKSYNVQALRDGYKLGNYAVMVKGTRRKLRKMGSSAKKAHFRNMVLTTAEGAGLGALGIGMPDIVIFVGMLLRGIYETALCYGFDYHSPTERLFILSMVEAALSTGEEWEQADLSVERQMKGRIFGSPPPSGIKEQVERTAGKLAADLLLMKFIQGIPVAGMVGGAANPLCYQKVMKYVRLKYWKRYLKKISGFSHADPK